MADNRVFVARRPLENSGGMKYAKGAHSAILIRQNGKYYLVEWLADSKVHLSDVLPNKVKQEQFVCLKNFSWTKQKVGTKLPSGMNHMSIYNKMKENMSVKEYGLFNHNCHCAQESTRLALGLATQDQLDYKEQAKKLAKK